MIRAMKKRWKQNQTVFTFPDGREETATFFLPLDDPKAEGVILSAVGETFQEAFAKGAIKAQTTCIVID